MKNGWEIKKLGDVSDFEGGSQPPKSKFIFEKRPGYVRFLQIRDFTKDKNITYIPESKKNRLCKEDDILIGRYGASVGKILTGKAGAYNVALMKTKPNLALFEKSWFYNYLVSDEFQGRLANVADRSAQNGFSKEDIFNFPVPIPPLTVQKRIVGILDEAFEGITTAKANAEKNLQNARAIFESHLQSVFTKPGGGWMEKRLVEIAQEFGRGKSKHRPRNDPKLYGGKYPFVQTGDVSNADHWLTNYSQTYGEVGLDQSRLWPKGTICIAIVGATVGETAILNFEACFPDSVIGIIVNEKLADNEYVEYLLQSYKALLKEKGQGTARDNINLGTFENQTFPFPSLKLQKEIVVTLNALHKETQHLESIYQHKLEALEELKKSLLNQAFTGEL